MIPFAVCDSGAISKLITRGAIADFFCAKNDQVCGGILMERMLGVQQPSPACGKCHRCARQALRRLLDIPAQGEEPAPGIPNASGAATRPSIAGGEDEATAKLSGQYGRAISYPQVSGRR